MDRCYSPQDIRLRALEKQDIPLLYSWENDPEALRSNGALNPLSEDFIASYVATSAQHILQTGSMGFIIEERASQRPLGHLVLYDYKPIHRRLALGIYITHQARKQGIATLALRQAIDYAFTHLRCEQVYAELLADNQSSQRLLATLGFTHTATLPSWHWTGSNYQDLLFYQLWNK